MQRSQAKKNKVRNLQYNLLGQEIYSEMFALIAERKVGNRPGRLEPRTGQSKTKNTKTQAP
ncbi:MAG: hypothetical protein OFPII_00110 [Osedax symbiont Rs1]|nr:MAG: hypothetical protein OFPII_00110 [Osedax symbiont Rs1]